MHYLWWVPATIIFYAAFSWISVKSNQEEGLKWPIILYVYGALTPIWVIISKVSNRLLFDGLLYDNLMFLTYAVTIILLGAHAAMGTIQWCGVGLVILGSILMRTTF